MSKHTIDNAMIESCVNDLLRDFTIKRKWTHGADKTEPDIRKYLESHLKSLVSTVREKEAARIHWETRERL